jgi:hypothetical protein
MAEPLRRKYFLKQRCGGDTFHGSVRGLAEQVQGSPR